VAVNAIGAVRNFRSPTAIPLRPGYEKSDPGLSWTLLTSFGAIGFYRDKQLRYAARVHVGFVPLTKTASARADQDSGNEEESCGLPKVEYSSRSPAVPEKLPADIWRCNNE
jgi:hypothetical protein